MTDTQAQSMRNWKGSDGKFEVEASYIGLFQNTKVKLRKNGGGMIAVPLDRLCEADVAYIAARSGQSDLASKTNPVAIQKPDNPKEVDIPSPTLGLSFLATTTTASTSPPQHNAPVTSPTEIQPLPPAVAQPQSNPPSSQAEPRQSIPSQRVPSQPAPPQPTSWQQHVPQQIPQQQATSMSSQLYQTVAHTAIPATAMQALSISAGSPLPTDGYFSRKPHQSDYTGAHHPQSATETLLLTQIEHNGPQVVRPMRPESVQLLSQRSLSSITERLQGQWQPRPQNLADFPLSTLANIAKHLDARTRVRLASVSRSFLQVTFRPPVWRDIWFLRHDLYRVDSALIHAMTQTLMNYQLYHAVHNVKLDGAAITADAVIHMLVNFLSLRSLSIKGCWEVHSFPLGGKLMHIAATYGNRSPIQLERIELGKALRRGIDKKELESKPNAPQSFGQDVAVIRNALEQLAGRPIQIDCYLCDFCHVGASAPMLMCAACGTLPIHKCLGCAPKCDRCSIRVCGLPQCRAKSIQITATPCNQCEKPLSLCNQRNSKQCVEARNPCSKCQGVYHIQCRAPDGAYVSNQCTRCGIVACPTCELTGCAGGCRGQWCRECTEQAGLSHCKCLILQTKTGGKMRKRNVCRNCRKGCAKCSTTGFCTRCLGVHQKQCRK
ncbi:hypothetical protein BJV82DRAFT_4558 [Fennellomyces sp. T-0311]|nr:hypothetical protein BJV82DRAFT_4558 [Fennellomyces sp. T-0311]